MSTGAWVNEFTGQPSFSVPLAGISNQGGIRFGIGLHYYGGGLEHRSASQAKYNPVSWVGEGFSFSAPSISAQPKGTLSLEDDDYSISLDGQSFVSLIPENGNPDVLYASNNPFIKVQRERLSVTMTPSDPYLNADFTAPPTSVPSQSAEQVIGWTVTFPDGSKYKFGSGSAACDSNNAYSYCVPVIGDKLGYQPFYNYGGGTNTSRIAVQWYLKEIRSTDNNFSIFLEYEKITQTVTGITYTTGGPASPSVSVDRAIYLRKVYSVNGSSSTDPKITTVVLNREARNPADYFDNSAIDPLAHFETQRLASISTYVRDNSSPEITFQLSYTPDSVYSRTRLREIKEIKGSRERRLYTFIYDDPGSAPWRLKTVKAPNSAEWTYSYAPPMGAFSQDPQILDLKALDFGGSAYNPIADFTKPRVFLHQEIGSKLYLGLEEGDSCSSPAGDKWKRRLVEIENFGTHWAVQRAFKAPQASCSEQSAIVLAPDGSYMAWAIMNSVKIYALTPRLGPGGAIDLATPPVGMQLLNSSLRQADPLPKPALFPFQNWLAAYDRVHGKSVTFFYKGSGGTWVQDQSVGCAAVPSQTIANAMNEGFQSTSPCLDYSPPHTLSNIEVRGGHNFIAVAFNEITSTAGTGYAKDGASIRLYSFHNGGIKEFNLGLKKSRKQKFGATNRIPLARYEIGMPDRDFIWDPDLDRSQVGTDGFRILDLAVRGNMIALLIGTIPGGTTSPGIYECFPYVFSYDGLQLRLLYQNSTYSYQSSNINPNIFLGENRFYLRHEGTSPGFEEFAFNPKTWSVAGPISNPPLGSLKALDGFFHVEFIPDRSQSYKPAVVGPGMAPYPASSNTGRLYRSDPAGGAPTQVTGLNPNPVPASDFLYNLFQREDRFLGIAQNASAGNAWTYVYGHMRAAGNQVRWLPDPTGVQGMSAILISTGAMTMEQAVTTGTEYKFTGVLRFHGDYQGSLLNDSTPPPSVVTRLEVSTKGAQSSLADGSLKKLDIVYPSSPRLNHASKVPNLNRAVVTGAGGKKKQTTDYLVDYAPRDPTLPANTLFQGMVASAQLSNIPVSGSGLRPGDARTQFHYKINTIATGWDGSTLLKESIKVPFPTKINQDQYYFDASRATETRFALPSEINGQPRITVTKKGGDYYVSVVRFLHEFGSAAANNLPAQTASYLFKGADPCTGTAADDPCSNLVDFNWLIPASGNPNAPANAARATSSSVFTYTSLGYLSAQYSWRSKESSVSALTTLNGTTPTTDYLTQGKWIKESEVLLRPSDHASIQCKQGNPTLLDVRGIRTTSFYSGREGLALATVKNASNSVSTFLDAEEEVNGTGRGAFGEWETQGSVSTDMAHTGTHSIKTTASFGPSVNVAFRRDANFWARGKGLSVSGWMFVPSASANPGPAALIELRANASSAPISAIDLLGQYKAAHSGAFPFDRWFKLEALITWDELNSVPFTEIDSNSNPLARIWFGKADPASNAYPVYVDDLRVHPADAMMVSQTYDASRRITSRSDAENNPAFFQYDAWGGGLSVKDDKGRLFSTTAYKRIED